MCNPVGRKRDPGWCAGPAAVDLGHVRCKSRSIRGWAGWLLRGLAPAVATALLLPAWTGPLSGQATRYPPTPAPAEPADAWTQLETRARAALRLTPDVGDLHATLAEALWRQGRLAEAEESARRAVRLDPEHPVYRGVLGQVLLARRRWEEAEREFRAALRVDSVDVEHQLGLGHALLAQGERAAAESAYGRARYLDPDHPDLLRVERALSPAVESSPEGPALANEARPWPIRVLTFIFRGAFAAILLAAGGLLALPAVGALYLLLVRVPLHLFRRRTA